MRRAFVIAAVLLALAGCNRHKSPNGRVEIGPGGNITINSPDGQAVVRTGGAPGHIEGLPDYPGATTNGGAIQISGASGQGSGAMVTFQTADQPAQVIDFYTRAAQQQGMRIAVQMNSGTTSIITATRGEGNDGAGFNVAATRAGDVTQVQVMAGAGR
jgi:hypothetical protein